MSVEQYANMPGGGCVPVSNFRESENVLGTIIDALKNSQGGGMVIQGDILVDVFQPA